MIAGTIYHEYFNDVWELDREEKTWALQKAGGKVPSPRFGHTTALLPDGLHLLLFGGSNNSVWSCDTYLFNAATLVWSELTVDVKPTERRGHSMVAIHDCVYLYGGQSSNSQKNIWEFNPATMAWSEVIPSASSTALPDARYCHSAVVYNGAMMVWGGHGSWGCVTPNLYAFHAAKKEWSQWETMGSAPGPRFGHAAVCTGHRMVVFGGMDVHPTGTSFNDMFQLNLFTHVWSQVTLEGSIPRGRRLHSIADVESMFVVFGGVERD